MEQLIVTKTATTTVDMKPATPEAEASPLTQVRKAVFGGSRKHSHLISGLLALPLMSSIISAADIPSGRLRNPGVDWDSLPIIRTGVRVWSHTSKNPLNYTVMDWCNYTLKDTNGYQQAYFKGKPGMLVHAWFGSYTGVGNLKLHLGDQPTPDYNQPFLKYFNGTSYPFWLWYHKNNILWAFPCLPFDSTFKATVEKMPQWYQYTLHIYREPRFSEAVTVEESAILKNRIAAPVGTFPGANSGNRTQSLNSVVIPAQGTATLFDVHQAGVIRSIKIIPPTTNSTTLDNLTIRLTTDGAITAEIPVSLFFGGYVNMDITKAKGIAAGFDGKSLYCYFPMPFWQSMKMELVNNQSHPVTLACNIGWSDSNNYPPESTGTFKVRYNNQVSVVVGGPSLVNLEVEGSGMLVGCSSEIAGGGEGNFTTYVDDSETPVIETTGGEDYFNHSYGMHDGFCTAFSGGLGMGVSQGTGYRFQIIDYVPFLRSIKFTQDYGRYFSHESNCIITSATFYYHNPRKLLTLTDEIDVGKTESETAHGYRITGSPGRVRLQIDSGRYENDMERPLTDDGRWTDKETSFTAAISPDNDGVRIRKRINQTAYHQEIAVYVDGTLAGTWFEQGANYVQNYWVDRNYYGRLEKKYKDLGLEVPTWQNGTMPALFRDVIFDIPASLTQGKKKLNLRFVTISSLAVDPNDAGLTNEYYYWIYTYAKVR